MLARIFHLDFVELETGTKAREQRLRMERRGEAKLLSRNTRDRGYGMDRRHMYVLSLSSTCTSCLELGRRHLHLHNNNHNSARTSEDASQDLQH